MSDAEQISEDTSVVSADPSDSVRAEVEREYAGRLARAEFDVVFGEDKSQVRTRNTPAVLAAVRDLIRSALKLAGYVNTAAGRRAHTERHRVLALYGIT